MSWANCENRHRVKWFGGKGSKLQGRSCSQCNSTNLRHGDSYKRSQLRVLSVHAVKDDLWIRPDQKVYITETIDGQIRVDRWYRIGLVDRPERGEDDTTVIELVNYKDETVGHITVPDIDYQKFLNLRR